LSTDQTSDDLHRIAPKKNSTQANALVLLTLNGVYSHYRGHPCLRLGDLRDF
jgi:hypothetical protein